MAVPGETVLAAAKKGIADGSYGAGDVVLAPGLTVAAMAVVLEPEVDAQRAREMAPLAMVAIADALGSLLPPKVAIEHRWPGVVLLNGGEAARVSVEMSTADPDQVPDWLIIAIEVQLALDESAGEPGQNESVTCLAEEGGAEIMAENLLSTTAAHLLSWLDIWQSEGAEPVLRSWLFRARGRTEAAIIGRGDDARLAQIHSLLPGARLRVSTAGREDEILEWPCLQMTLPLGSTVVEE